MNVKCLLTGKGISHMTLFYNESYRDHNPDGHGGFMVPRHALPKYIHLNTKCLTLAVPGQE